MVLSLVVVALGVWSFCGGHNTTCYFPFLLSYKLYIIVKNPKLQKILISDQVGRSKSSQTRPEDRDKMAALGVVHYIIQIPVLCGMYALSLWLIVSKVANISFDLAFFDGFFGSYI